MVAKQGYRTTEFALALLTGIGAVAAALAGELSPKWAAVATSVSVGAYAIARGLAKTNPNAPSVVPAPLRSTAPPPAPPTA